MSSKFKIRIKEHRIVSALELLPHGKNPRRHPAHQSSALRKVLDLVGFVQEILVVETPEGLKIVDGHLRTGIAEDANVPVAVLDLTEDEVMLVMQSLDPIGAMAKIDAEALEKNVREMTEHQQEFLSDILKQSSLHKTAFAWKDQVILNPDSRLQPIPSHIEAKENSIENEMESPMSNKPMTKMEQIAAKLEKRVESKFKYMVELSYANKVLLDSAIDASGAPKDLFIVEASKAYLKGLWSIDPTLIVKGLEEEIGGQDQETKSV